jgi:hypothetical protein
MLSSGEGRRNVLLLPKMILVTICKMKIVVSSNPFCLIYVVIILKGY